MLKRIITLALLTPFFVGCASIPLESSSASSAAKQFNPPTEGKAGLYIYRDSLIGAALKKDIWIDGLCVGESAAQTFFYEEVSGNAQHKVSTESEFSPNDLHFIAERNKLYFIKQYIKLGLFVGGADVKLVSASEGKSAIAALDLAKKGNCSQ